MPPSRHTPWLQIGSALLGACLVFGCTVGPEGPGSTGQKKSFYFDAELQFAVEFPTEWRLRRGRGQEPESCSVYWYAPAPAGEAEAAAEATVVACPSSRWPEGADAMRDELLAAHPGLTLERRQGVALPTGAGELLEGRDASRHYLVTVLPTERRGYIVSLSAPVDAFEALRPLFEEMLDSFEPVETD